jgi:hypothetical protein
MARPGISMTRRFSVPLALAVVPFLLFAAPYYSARGVLAAQAGVKRGKPKPCPDQRYLVEGSPVLPGDSIPDVIVISGKHVALGTACAPTTAKFAVRSRGTRVKAKWSSCTGLPGKVKLRAMIAPACELMQGTVKAHRLRLRRRFNACPDGVINYGAGERCGGGTVITVNTTTDTPRDGRCSFQEAVRAANTSAAVDACPAGTPGANNTIAFNIPGSGIQTIPVTSVTQITTPITIDGSTQLGYAGVPLIHITGAVEDLLRFSVDATGSSLKHLMLTNTNAGGLIDGATALFYSDNNTIIGNYFNTDGVAVLGSHGAGLLFDSSENNVIGGPTAATRNIFGGQTGIYLQDSSRNLIEGNYFGVQPDGNTAISGLPRDGNGILIFNVIGNATANTVRGNVVTGFIAGIHLSQGSNANILQGNHIGVASDGVTVRSNGIGVLVYGAPNNTIGGETVADRNIISGNEVTNITLQSYAQQGAENNSIEGNYIGPDASGLNPVNPNALFGIFVTEGASGNVISANVVAGNQQGIYIDETSAVAGASSLNCISGNATYGVNNANTVSAGFGSNWWGDASGPRYIGHAVGAGDWVSSNVTFVPFLTSKPATCPGGPTGGTALPARAGMETSKVQAP